MRGLANLLLPVFLVANAVFGVGCGRDYQRALDVDVAEAGFYEKVESGDPVFFWV